MMAFLLMPFYTYLAFLTFGRRYNYGEHLVINAYIQGFSMISSVVFFMASILFLPRLYSFMVFVTMFYYLLTYKRLYELSWGKAFLKLVIFLIILVISMIMITIIGAICAFLFLVIKKDILGM